MGKYRPKNLSNRLQKDGYGDDKLAGGRQAWRQADKAKVSINTYKQNREVDIDGDRILFLTNLLKDAIFAQLCKILWIAVQHYKKFHGFLQSSINSKFR